MKTNFKKIGAIIIFAAFATFRGTEANAQQTQTNAAASAKTCKGTTKKGQPCRSTFIIKGKDFCNDHNPEAIKCSGKNSKKENCGMKVKEAGSFCKFHFAKN